MVPRLLALVSIAALLGAQDAPASRAPRVVELPPADQAKPIPKQVLIVVEVFRSSGEAGSGWRIGLTSQTYDVQDDAFADRFPAHLERLAKASGGAGTAVLIRADANAPATVILHVLEGAATAKLSRVLLEAEPPAGAPRRAIECRLPRDEDPLDPEGLPDIRLRAGVDRDAQVQRVFDLNPKLIPVGAEGDEQLAKMLAAKHDDYAKLWKVPIPVVVESGKLVPWRHVLDLVNLAKRAGAERIEFAAAPELPARRPPSREPAARPAPPVEPSPGEPATRPAPETVVPAATQAAAFDDQDAVEVWVFRDDTALWRLQLGDRAFATDAAGLRGVEVRLAALSRAKFPGASARSLLIRADAQAPWAVVARTMTTAAVARFYKIHFAAGDPGGRQALPCWLPIKKGAEEPDIQPLEIRMILSWNPAANKLERLYGQSMYPTTPEGAAKLESALRRSHERHRAESKDVPLVLDVGPKVPFRHVIEAIDLGRRVGISQIQFGMAEPPR
jgi:biopolymer transport protein ExbD